jgi:hypothetical protein
VKKLPWRSGIASIVSVSSSHSSSTRTESRARCAGLKPR